MYLIKHFTTFFLLQLSALECSQSDLWCDTNMYPNPKYSNTEIIHGHKDKGENIQWPLHPRVYPECHLPSFIKWKLKLEDWQPYKKGMPVKFSKRGQTVNAYADFLEGCSSLSRVTFLGLTITIYYWLGTSLYRIWTTTNFNTTSKS